MTVLKCKILLKHSVRKAGEKKKDVNSMYIVMLTDLYSEFGISHSRSNLAKSRHMLVLNVFSIEVSFLWAHLQPTFLKHLYKSRKMYLYTTLKNPQQIMPIINSKAIFYRS